MAIDQGKLTRRMLSGTAIWTCASFVIVNLLYLGVMALMGQEQTVFKFWMEFIPVFLIAVMLMSASYIFAFRICVGIDASRNNGTRTSLLKTYFCCVISLAVIASWLCDCDAEVWIVLGKGCLALLLCLVCSFWYQTRRYRLEIKIAMAENEKQKQKEELRQMLKPVPYDVLFGDK